MQFQELERSLIKPSAVLRSRVQFQEFECSSKKRSSVLIKLKSFLVILEYGFIKSECFSVLLQYSFVKLGVTNGNMSALLKCQ